MSAELGLKTYWTGDKSQYAGGVSSQNLTHLQHVEARTWRTHPNEQLAYFKELTDTFNETLKSNEKNHYTDLLQWLEQNNKNYFVVTSNIDNAFHHYGYAPEKVFEVHGSLTHSQCTQASRKHGVFLTNDTQTCPKCGTHTRPNILHFDDVAFNRDRTKSQEAYFRSWLYRSHNLTVLEMGVGSTVPTIKHITETLRVEENSTVLQVNPDLRSQYTLTTRHPHRPSGPRLAVQLTTGKFVNMLTQAT